MNASTISTETMSPRSVAIATSLLVLIGLSAALVNAHFLVEGLRQTDGDSVSRLALTANGVLFIVFEMMAFGIASILPKAATRGVRSALIVLGVVVVIFEVVPIYISQELIAKSMHNTSRGSSERIVQLRESIASMRATADSMILSGSKDAQSQHSWVRQSGAKTLREAAAMQEAIAQKSNELASLQSNKKHSVTDIIGETGTKVFNLVRSVLTVVIGLACFGCAGALVRFRRLNFSAGAATSRDDEFIQAQGVFTDVSAYSPMATDTPLDAPSVSVSEGVSGVSDGVSLGVSSETLGNLSPADGCIKVSSVAGRSPNTPSVDTAINSGKDEDNLIAYARLEQIDPEWTTSAVFSQEDQPCKAERLEDSRYAQVREAVIRGDLIPGVRSIARWANTGAPVSRRYLTWMMEEGIVVRRGFLYQLSEQRVSV